MNLKIFFNDILKYFDFSYQTFDHFLNTDDKGALC